MCFTAPGLRGRPALINTHCDSARGAERKGYPISRLQIERLAQPTTIFNRHLETLSVLFCFVFAAPTTPQKKKKSWSFFISFCRAHTRKITIFFTPPPPPSSLSTHKSGTLLCIDRKLTFTVAVIYMVMKGSVSPFISSFSVSSLQRRGGETPPAYQDKAIWMDNTFSSTYKGLSRKEQAHLLQQSHSSR